MTVQKKVSALMFRNPVRLCLKCKSLNSRFMCPLDLRLSLRAYLSANDIDHPNIACIYARLGMNKGIHTIIIAMLSCNDVIAIFLFGVLLGIVFSTGNLTHQLLQGPVGIVMGCVFGAASGLATLKLPSDTAVGAFFLFHTFFFQLASRLLQS